jgi:hypothetical protein
MSATPSNDSVARQVEINEWTYNNKMETVFVMQVSFVGIAIVAIMQYFKRTGAVGAGFALYVSSLVGILLGLLILNRVFYTSARRDPRYWNRRRFNEDNSKVPSSTINNPSWGDFWSSFATAMPAKPTTCPTCPQLPAAV